MVKAGTYPVPPPAPKPTPKSVGYYKAQLERALADWKRDGHNIHPTATSLDNVRVAASALARAITRLRNAQARKAAKKEA